MILRASSGRRYRIELRPMEEDILLVVFVEQKWPAGHFSLLKYPDAAEGILYLALPYSEPHFAAKLLGMQGMLVAAAEQHTNEVQRFDAMYPNAGLLWEQAFLSAVQRDATNDEASRRADELVRLLTGWSALRLAQEQTR